MGIPAKVVIRDCLAIAAILLCVASAAAQAQVLASYKICAVSTGAACTETRALSNCARPAPSEHERFLQWAVALHRAGASDARVALRTVNPVVATDEAIVEVADVMRNIACSH